MAESEEELKSDRWKKRVEKPGLKLNFQKTKIMASGPITSWQTDGETIETVRNFIFSGSKITADGNCSHEIKSGLLLGRKAMTNLDSVLESRRHYFAYKSPCCQSYVFPVVMYRCESWTIKKGWAPKNWWLWMEVLKKTFESPLDCKEKKSVNPKGN